MSAPVLGEVICMVRGGEASRIVQEQAIAFARKKNKKLVFLHIIDLDSLSLDNEILLEAARMEVTWLARVNLILAYRRAKSAGIEAEMTIRFGPIFKSVIEFLQERNAYCLFLGTPRRGVRDYEERIGKVQHFAEQIQNVTGISVCIGSSDEIKTLPGDRLEGQTGAMLSEEV